MMLSPSLKKCGFLGIFLIAFLLLPGSSLPAGENNVEKSEHKIAKRPLIVFLITEDTLNYEAHKTIPMFAEKIRKEYGYEVAVLLGRGPHGACRFPDIHKIDDAALLIVFSRRIAVPHDQMEVIKNYLSKGKPLIGIRTANHAFTNRTKIEPGFEDWPGFVSEILGCENRGYGPVEPGVNVSVQADAVDHPILQGVQPRQWHSDGNIYKVAPLLDKEAKVLLTGTVDNITEPVAWIRKAGKSKVFYTSLGYPTDFKSAPFLTLLTNVIQWSLAKKSEF
jgi:type 1 glutamine amidotransferase